ncbi:MAG: elongation factor Ts, partial [Microcoleus sp. T3-bin5]|nr:elongation factor Ts [Microcoleus sp. T3-bin5]
MKEISAKLVQELRAKTGVGLMKCKKALQESDGDIAQAIERLRQKGELLAAAGGNSEKEPAEGLIASYIHTGSRVGVLLEVNCDTDFVARNEVFQALVRNISMQIAACPNVEYVQVSDIPAEISEKEKEIEMGRDDVSDKPESVKEKIVQGRIEIRLKELCLMEQAYIRDQIIS